MIFEYLKSHSNKKNQMFMTIVLNICKCSFCTAAEGETCRDSYNNQKGLCESLSNKKLVQTLQGAESDVEWYQRILL